MAHAGLQTSRNYSNAWECAAQTVRNEGLRGLYRGLAGPFFAQGAYKAILFGVYGWTSRRTTKTTPEVFACGSLAGAANAIVLTPVELIRNRQQVQTRESSFWHTARLALSQRGGLYRGFGATLCRDVPGVGMYYLTFERLRGHTFGQNLVAGAAGGIAFWTVALPFDHLKSRLQVDPSLDLITTLRSTSLSRLYIGYGAALMRGVPGAAVVFAVYGHVLGFLGGHH